MVKYRHFCLEVGSFRLCTSEIESLVYSLLIFALLFYPVKQERQIHSQTHRRANYKGLMKKMRKNNSVPIDTVDIAKER